MNEDVRRETDGIVRALFAVRMMTGIPTTPDPLMDALVALEAARTARDHADRLVNLVARAAVDRGASLEALGPVLEL
ncbi:hypothetical protein GCM10010435_24950 [Winogradskya consettensis]|uniref:Uncharacterized protein n=1 Tax=Winogradskya consettensis TaxID=113560 RepID=A0A919SAB5_9ACTN|nr:hypothetical protein [Actinoplanes consettensis]GIM67773.1 hypothetical protein Aco04nite_07740 [Actinoplanes consettensis]